MRRIPFDKLPELYDVLAFLDKTFPPKEAGTVDPLGEAVHEAILFIESYLSDEEIEELRSYEDDVETGNWLVKSTMNRLLAAGDSEAAELRERLATLHDLVDQSKEEMRQFLDNLGREFEVED